MTAPSEAPSIFSHAGEPVAHAVRTSATRALSGDPGRRQSRVLRGEAGACGAEDAGIAGAAACRGGTAGPGEEGGGAADLGRVASRPSGNRGEACPAVWPARTPCL